MDYFGCFIFRSVPGNIRLGDDPAAAAAFVHDGCTVNLVLFQRCAAVLDARIMIQRGGRTAAAVRCASDSRAGTIQGISWLRAAMASSGIIDMIVIGSHA